jgi:ABC-type branched-subunit amino acid transport system substrate-binding protein
MAATALRLINRYGGDVTLRTVTTGDYNEGTATQTTSDQTVKGVISNYTAYDLANTLVQADDRRVTIAASGLTSAPTSNDLVVIGNVVGRVVMVTPTAPSGTPLVYDLQVRF